MNIRHYPLDNVYILAYAQCGNCGNLLSIVWKLRKFTLTHFWQKFRESNGFTEITKFLTDLTKKKFGEESRSFIFPQCAFHTYF